MSIRQRLWLTGLGSKPKEYQDIGVLKELRAREVAEIAAVQRAMTLYAQLFVAKLRAKV